MVALALYELAWRRFTTFHNETFDLALYGRMAWGMVRGQFWDPVTNANTFGVHVMPILWPLGVVAEVLGAARTLLATQAVALAFTAVPLFEAARRRIGVAGGAAIALLWWTYPHIFHVASYEFHPGNLGVFFLACASALQMLSEPKRPLRRAWWVMIVLAICCREDIALSAACLILMRSTARAHIQVALGCVTYFLLFAFVAVPVLGPAKNSVVLHFGQWGSSLPEVALYLLMHPIELLAYVFSATHLVYLAKLFGCLAFLPLLAPRWILPALPFIGMNLISVWPTATELDSHYQTLILPFLFLATIEGVDRVQARRSWLAPVLLGVAIFAAAAAHLRWGGSWVSSGFEQAAFSDNARSRSARRIVKQIPDSSSVQAPYALMPHLIRRYWVAAAPPPDRDFEFVVLDLSMREAYRGSDTVLRTDEEPFFRAWLGRTDYGIVAYEAPYALVRRGAKARDWAAAEGYLLASTASGDEGQRITSCLRLLEASLEADAVVLRLVADKPCDKDLAVRLGDTYRPKRVDLLFDGLLNPAQLKAGDVLRSAHRVSDDERAGLADTGVCLGAVRQSGVRPEKVDPVSVCLPVR